MDITPGESPIGEVIQESGPDGIIYNAFIPHPLPSSPTIGIAAYEAATQAAMAVARLDQALSQLPEPSLLARPIIRREAVSTSALEGTYAALDEVLEADFLEARQMSNELREVHNFVHATSLAMELTRKYPISLRVICELQKEIVKGTPGDKFDAGMLRQQQVYIGARGRRIEDARFVPPPPGPILQSRVSEWEKWINEHNSVPLVIKMALGHYQFEALHPFSDGNGRVGRLVAILQLTTDNTLRLPALNLSPWLESHRDQYIDSLLRVSKTGDFDSWITFFSQAVQVQAYDGIATIAELLAYKDATIVELRSSGARGIILQIVENLIGYPILDIPTVRKLTGKTFEASNQAVARLVDHGILREITGRRINRLFICDPVLRIINRAAPIKSDE